MKRFSHPGQRIKVVDAFHDELNGTTGTVTRLRRSDDGAWVNIDQGLPDSLRQFPADDSAGRGNHIVLAPEECEAL